MGDSKETRKAPCAICDDTNTTTRLCESCRADPANGDWSERWDDIALSGDIEKTAYVDKKSGGGCADLYRQTLADLEPAERKPTPLEVRVLVHGAVEEFRRYDQRGRFRGIGRRRVDLSQREIAIRVGCSRQLVDKVNKRYRSGLTN
jgi:hypothetical protein